LFQPSKTPYNTKKLLEHSDWEGKYIIHIDYLPEHTTFYEQRGFQAG